MARRSHSHSFCHRSGGTQAYILSLMMKLFEPNPNLWPGSISCLCERGRIPAPGVALCMVYNGIYCMANLNLSSKTQDSFFCLIVVVSISSFNVLSLSSTRAATEAIWMAWTGPMFRRSCLIVMGATLVVAEGWRRLSGSVWANKGHVCHKVDMGWAWPKHVCHPK